MRRPRPRAATGVLRRLRTSPLRKHGHSRRRGERINWTPVHRFSPRVMSVSRTARQTLMSTSCSASSTIISLGRNPALASTASAVRPASQPEKARAPPEASRHARASNEMRRIRSSRIDRTRLGRPAPPRRRHAATALLRLPPSSRAPDSTTRRLGVLKPGCTSRNYKSLVAPDVRRELVAAMAEHDKVSARKGPLETIPILFVAQGGWNEPVGASDPVVVRDDGVAIDLDPLPLCFL